MVFPKFEASISEVRYIPKKKTIQHEAFFRAELYPELSDTQLLSMSVSRIVKNRPKIFGYPEYQGYLELRHALAKHFTLQGFVHCAEQLVITHGCLNAVAIALAVTTTKNGVVAVSSPCYSGLLELLASMKRKVLEIPSTPQGIDLAQLKRYMSEGKVQACLLTANHQNPTGHSICNEQKQALVKLAETFEVPIIEDDVFRELNYLGDPPLPIKHYDHHGWVLWCSSVSKSLSAGLRLGWCSPGRYIDSYRDFVKAQSFGCNSITQLALADYIQRGHYQRHINKLKLTLSAQCLEYVTLIKTELQDQVIINSPREG